MENTPLFFVPAATVDNQESVYASFAEWCDYPIPEHGKRIYSISFVHDGDKWTATVGEQLVGSRQRISRSHGEKYTRTTPLHDNATVLAIFPGNPYKVVTNQFRDNNVGSFWANPAFVGRPTSVTHFRTE